MTAGRFLSLGIQDWGQSDEKRSEATQGYLRAAGFNVSVDPAPSARMVNAIKGPDAEPAMRWLLDVLKTMPRGKFETEVAHLESALNNRST